MKNRRRLFAVITIAALIFGILNIDVSIRQGVNGKYREIHMPLYVKWTQFLARHYEYARIAKEITAGCKTDEEKALAILNWTRANIKDIPGGLDLVDEHILTIMIKGYGAPAQFQDVFTTLCAYSGIPAFFEKVYAKGNKARYVLSFVKINGKWRVFDAYSGKYFRTVRGDLASPEDILDDESLTQLFDYDLKPVVEGKTLRPSKQMPLRRILFEAKKFLGLEKEDIEQ